MICFPHVKINLGLRVLGKRDDGYHDIETIFYPVKWCDALEALPEEAISKLQRGNILQVVGSKPDANIEDNLCMKALRLLESNHPVRPVKMCLLKNIPIGAGLGGGSSDAVFTLKLLNDLFQLNLSQDDLQKYASRLGSDCSFFMQHQPCFATGRGEMLQPVMIDLAGNHILIVYPGIHINTSWAYQQFAQRKHGSNSSDLWQNIHKPISTWKDVLVNDFEEIVFVNHPEIAAIKTELYRHGAVYASMSGSGSAVYGIFKEEPSVDLFPTHQCFRGSI
jgi:4-diphosphocytidyl-2-C-methyl-D-erythritol kinase